MMKLPTNSFAYLNQLRANNNRDWFQENKTTYDTLNTEVKAWFATLQHQLEEFDVIERTKIYRIYRDVRFSKDKTPYKTHFGAHISRATATRRGGYYVHIEPNNKSMVAVGFYKPERDDLFRIRKEFEIDDAPMRKILADKTILKYFPDGLQGEELKTAPRDFDKNDQAIDLIRKKSFYFSRQFSDKEVLSATFMNEVAQTFQASLSYVDYMSEVLTTNLNGERVF